MRTERVALILSLFALGVAGCGGGDDDDDVGTIPTVPLTVPGEDTTVPDRESTTGTTVEQTPAPAPAPTPAPPPPAPTPQQDLTPDSPQNDTPPPPGSEAEQFERFCDENPGAC